MPLTEKWPLYHKGLIGGVLQRSASGRFSHLHRGTLELCHSDHRVLGHLPVQGPYPLISPPIASSCKSLGSAKLLPFKNDEGHFVLGGLQCCRQFLVPFPRYMPRHNPVSELYGQFLRPHGLVFALTCTVNCGTLYRHYCGFFLCLSWYNIQQEVYLDRLIIGFRLYWKFH